MTGETLSHYKILGELGRGGMGIVYKAEDTKLSRTVAVKVLPIAALGNKDDRARFFREAQAAAQLHHSNIATVFAIEEAASIVGEERPFIAMEYIEGETLTERIARGPLKLDEAVEIATQTAQALEAAHEKNIVHRDIKSGNVMLTSRGVAKVLDFGLAQTAQSTKLTQLGSTLGTIAYMSPEQARGDEVDRRSDLWSLGVLLYEMIAGRLPFAGEYEQAAVYSILNEDPEPLTAIRTGVPMGIEWIVSKCLAKKRDERYQSATDLIVDLKTVDLSSSTLSRTSVSAMSAVSAPTTRTASGIGLKTMGAFVAVAALASLLTFLLTGRGSTTEQAHSWTVPIEIHLEDQEWSDFSDGQTLDISPDGTSLVYQAKSDGETFLYLRNFGETEIVKLEGTSNASHPKFSPDGRQVAFFQNLELRRVSVSGDFPQLILSAGAYNGGPGYSWTPDGDIIYVPDWGMGVWRVSTSGGEQAELVSPDREAMESGFSHPIMLADGKTIITVVWGSGYDIKAIDIETGRRTPIVSGGINPRYVAPGYLLYAQGDRLMAMSFDSRSFEAGESATVIDDGLLTFYDMQIAGFSVSEAGTLVYQAGTSEWDAEIVYRGFDGSTRTLMSGVGAMSAFSLSPDGKKIAYGMFTPRRDSDLFVYFLDTGEQRQVTKSPGYEGIPAWRKDSDYIYYSDQADGIYRVIGTSISVGAEPDTLDLGGISAQPTSVHANGDVVLEYWSDSNISDIGIASPNDDPAKIDIIADASEDEDRVDVSPDGRFVAYELGGGGDQNIYAQSLETKGDRVIVSSATSAFPRWSPSGRHLYYVTGNNLVKREHQGNLLFGPETLVLEDLSSPYDLWLDESGIVIRSAQNNRQVWIAFNFTRRLKELVPPIE